MIPDMSRFGYLFPKAGMVGFQGPNDPSGEFFTDVELEESLARELIQNALDARPEDSVKPVTVEFELSTAEVNDIPGILGLRQAVELALRDVEQLQGREKLEQAKASMHQAIVPVLRVSDFGTRGLEGSESLEFPKSALSALTRGTGVSSSAGYRGGSFGIGSAVGLVASRMRTVGYVSRPQYEDVNVYASASRLAGHRDGANVWRTRDGYFTNLAVKDDYEYLRFGGELAFFHPRSEPGTDVYIFDYVAAKSDPDLLSLMRSTVSNFLVAIHREALIVRGRSGTNEWVLNKETLADSFDLDDYLAKQVLPFYRALTQGEVIHGNLPTIGEVQLYVWPDDAMEKRLGTQYMRSPLMKVGMYDPASIPIPYAAVFICEDKDGNELLREIEPPTHNKWNDRGPRSNGKVVRQVRKFIRDELLQFVPDNIGDAITISGIERYLPLNLGTGSGTGNGPGSNRTGAAPEDSETAVRLGKPAGPSPLHLARDLSVHVQVEQSGVATDGAGDDGRSGERGGGILDRHKGRRDVERPVEPGEGSSLIDAGQVRLRSFVVGDGVTRLVLRAESSVSGDLRLVAIGAGENFPVEVASATLSTPRGRHPLEVEGAVIKALELVQGSTMELDIRFANASRYRIGVG